MIEKCENYWGHWCKLYEVIFDLVMSDNTLKMKKVMPSFCKGMKSVIIFKKNIHVWQLGNKLKSQECELNDKWFLTSDPKNFPIV